MEKLLSTQAVAEWLGLNVKTVERYAYRKKIKAKKLAGRWRFKPSDVENWVASNG